MLFLLSSAGEFPIAHSRRQLFTHEYKPQRLSLWFRDLSFGGDESVTAAFNN
jgi:hypothetical protein